VFPVILGLLGLGLALRRGLPLSGLPGDAAEVLLGAAAALWAFAALAYAAKLIRRPGVIVDEFRVLPARGGVAAASVGGMAVAAVLVPYAPGAAGALLIGALLAHAVQGVVLLAVLRGLPPEARRVNPTLHLSFVGFIVGGLAASGLGWQLLAQVLLGGTLPLAVVLWVVSALQLWREVPPAPLRPLLAIHLAPASLGSMVAGLSGHAGLAVALASVGGVMLSAIIARVRWMTAAGFTPLWGAFTFPLAAYAGALLGVGWVWPGLVVLIGAGGVAPAIAWAVLRHWPGGRLAARTNAARA